jgi:hypothetical protein
MNDSLATTVSELGSARILRAGEGILPSRTWPSCFTADAGRIDMLQSKFVAAECSDQHAASVRSPDSRNRAQDFAATQSTRRSVLSCRALGNSIKIRQHARDVTKAALTDQRLSVPEAAPLLC